MAPTLTWAAMLAPALCLLLAGAGTSTSAGPPVLPPLPGEEQPAGPPPDPNTATPAPTKKPPTKKANRSAAAPTPEQSPPPPSADPPSADPSSSAASAPSWSIPQAAEPPQPAGAPPRADGAPPPDSDPSQEKPAELRPPLGSESGLDSAGPSPWNIPPPRKPPYRGTGLFIGAGVTFALAIAEQVAAHILIKRRCIDPIANGDYEDSEDFGDVVAGCAPGVLPALALRLNSDLALLATIGLAAGGAATRGTHDAYDDVFGDRPQRTTVTLRAAGISLMGAGLLTWFATGAGGWAWLGDCDSGRCATRARLFTFLTRDTSAALVASGAGMLTFAEIYRRRHESFTRDRAFSVGPQVSGRGFGLTAAGRF